MRRHTPAGGNSTRRIQEQFLCLRFGLSVSDLVRLAFVLNIILIFASYKVRIGAAQFRVRLRSVFYSLFIVYCCATCKNAGMAGFGLS